jgi:hypothetical protein
MIPDRMYILDIMMNKSGYFPVIIYSAPLRAPGGETFGSVFCGQYLPDGVGEAVIKGGQECPPSHE